MSSQYLDELSPRSCSVVEMRERAQAIVADQGGKEALSYVRRSLIERFIRAEALVQSWEADIFGGRMDDNEQQAVANFFTGVNTLIRLADKLGLQRRVRKLRFDEYVQQRDKELGNIK